MDVTSTPFFRLGVDELANGLDNAGATQPAAAIQAANDIIRDARKDVPAYGALCQAAPKAEEASVDLYREAPFVTKDNYFKKWSLPERSWRGVLQAVNFVHCSSGSTGSPTLWPRTILAELTVACTFQRVFHDAFRADERRTLAMVVFPLGSWVGGLFTTICLNYLSMKGYKVTLVTPGNKMEDILKLAPELCPHFEQTVILGYPPFVKGVIDAGVAQGVKWHEFDIGLVLAGEVYSEEWRRLVASRAGIASPGTRIVSLYGTADAGVIAAESPVSAAMREWLAAHPTEASELFKAERLPTLCQYDPCNRLLDKLPSDDTLVVTCLTPPALLAASSSGDGSPEAARKLAGPPTIKYAIGDAGGLMSFDDMCSFLRQRGMDIDATLAGISCVRKLPFVWVFGRSFWCVSVYGANVYVENIMVGMEQPDVASHVTGKFVLFIEENASLDKHLAIRVELQAGQKASPDVESLISRQVTSHLCRLNSEYANYVPGSEQAVRVHLHEFGDPKWFPIGVKHKYTL